MQKFQSALLYKFSFEGHANCFARTKEERRDKLIWNNNRFFSPPKILWFSSVYWNKFKRPDDAVPFLSFTAHNEAAKARNEWMSKEVG